MIGRGPFSVTGWWQEIRRVQAGLPPVCKIISIGDSNGARGGVITDVGAEVAARMIVDGRARLATPEEAEADRIQQEEAGRNAQTRARIEWNPEVYRRHYGPDRVTLPRKP